jgi:hypothetical protein
MSTTEPRPKRARKMSRRQRRALNLPSDPSASGSSSSGDEGSLDGSVPSTPAPTAPSILQPATLERSQSTASLASQPSVPAIGAKADDERRSKFDKRYKTATSTDDEVLSSSFYLSMTLCFSEYIIEENQMDQWSSDVYKHFKMPPAITVKNGIVTYVFTCIA